MKIDEKNIESEENNSEAGIRNWILDKSTKQLRKH